MRRIAMVIMAKAPQAGKVKTRLCPPFSPAEAAELYRCFLLDTIAKIRTLTDVCPVIAYTPESGRRFFETVAPDFTLMPQQGDDLGARMAMCIVQLFDRGYNRVVLTGSDLPTLPTVYLQQAVALIAKPHIDVVLGPSEDGGYYLIGLHQLHRELFDHMRWSIDTVFAETLRRAEAKGLKVARLPPWYDIDTPADLQRLRSNLHGKEGNALQHTRRFLLEQAE